MREEAVAHVSFDILTAGECRQLLGEGGVGRIVIGRPNAAPIVRPVNYVVDGDAIVFRLGPGSAWDSIGRDPVAFEVDGIDAVRRGGWSVIVEGRAYEATHWEVDHLGLEPWAPGPRVHWIRITPEFVTGRRIRWTRTDPHGYL